MPRWPARRRRPVMRPDNVRRRLSNRLIQVIAALLIGGCYWAWNTYVGDDNAGVTLRPEAAMAATGAGTVRAETGQPSAGIDAVIRARRSNAQVEFSAEVLKNLPDDNKGARHQRFLVTTAGGNRVLVAHNIDLAPRIDGLAAGQAVRLNGEFEWNEKGGVVHWTHRDPAGKHADGWIEHQGRRYQ